MDIPPPSPRIRKPRLTDKLRAMKPGESALLPIKTALALRSHGRYLGWKMVQRSEGKEVRVWRLE